MKKELECKTTISKKPRGGLRRLVMGVAIAGALTLAGCVTYGNLNLLKSPIIPKGFVNYRERGTIIDEYDFIFGGMFVHHIGYDLDDNGELDVGELYLIPMSEGNEPIIYAFDENDNGSFQVEELYVDEEMDGINGNEVRLDDFGIKNTRYI